MANIAIVADFQFAVTIDTPPHTLFDLAAHSMHLRDLSVTPGTFDAGLYVRPVREVNVGRAGKPVDSHPGGLLASFSVSGKLPDLRLVSLRALVTGHAGGYVRYRRVSRFVRVLVTKGALELRSVFFSHMLPVIISHRLDRPARFISRAEQQDPGQQGQNYSQ
jgi:hypothetical protein